MTDYMVTLMLMCSVLVGVMSSACSYSPRFFYILFYFIFYIFICLLFLFRKGTATINLPVSPSPYMYVPSMSSAVCKLPYNRKDWQTFLRVCNSNILLSLYLSCALSLSLSRSLSQLPPTLLVH